MIFIFLFQKWCPKWLPVCLVLAFVVWAIIISYDDNILHTTASYPWSVGHLPPPLTNNNKNSNTSLSILKDIKQPPLTISFLTSKCRGRMGNILCVYSHLYVNRLKFPNLRVSVLGTLQIRLATPLRDYQLLPVFTFKTNFRRNIFLMTPGAI